ncbi:hypothetical protein D0N36_05460 [Hymenobacter lapidiphilus]|nr:hypothetical protein D0N36_05460 [Hymenobacter sp. CCM 8763]
MFDATRYEDLHFPKSLQITALIYRSFGYYSDWLSPVDGGEQEFRFHCSACDNAPTDVSMRQASSFWGNNSADILHEAARPFDGLGDIGNNNGHHFGSSNACFIGCRKCATAHLIIIGYDEPHNGHDAYKVSTIFTYV